MPNITRRLVVWAIVGVLILTLLVVMPFTDEVQWNEAVAYGIILLVVGGFYELWQWLKRTRTRTYRIAFGIGLLGVFLLGWVSGAVGIIGSENQPVNLMLLGSTCCPAHWRSYFTLKPRWNGAYIACCSDCAIVGSCNCTDYLARSQLGQCGRYRRVRFQFHFRGVFCRIGNALPTRQYQIWIINRMKRQNLMDKKKLLRKLGHLTRPPRLEGAVKNKMMNPIRKKKKVEKPY